MRRIRFVNYKPNTAWILRNKVLMPQRRWWWLKGKEKADGFVFTTRGIPDAFLAISGHEKFLRNEILGKGHLFVDIGAHVGTYSIRATRLYDQVVAFEPTNATRKVLEKNRDMNHVTNLTIYPVALGDSEGWATIYHFPFISGYGGNSLHYVHPFYRSKHGKFANKVDVRTLDSYGLQPDLIKIDVEGFELEVLKGASETMKRTRKLVVEVHSNHAEVRELLYQAGFKLRAIITELPTGPQTHLVAER